MSEALQIRPLSREDELQACARMMAGTEPWITLRRSYEQAVEVFQQNRDLTFVAYLQDDLVGFVILQMEGALTGYIKSLAVDSERRGQGIGRAIISFAEDYIFARKTNVFLFVSSFNPRAQALYTALGYEQVGRVPNLIIEGHDEVLMRKTIGPMVEG